MLCTQFVMSESNTEGGAIFDVYSLVYICTLAGPMRLVLDDMMELGNFTYYVSVLLRDCGIFESIRYKLSSAQSICVWSGCEWRGYLSKLGRQRAFLHNDVSAFMLNVAMYANNKQCRGCGEPFSCNYWA